MNINSVFCGFCLLWQVRQCTLSRPAERFFPLTQLILDEKSNVSEKKRGRFFKVACFYGKNGCSCCEVNRYVSFTNVSGVRQNAVPQSSTSAVFTQLAAGLHSLHDAIKGEQHDKHLKEICCHSQPVGCSTMIPEAIHLASVVIQKSVHNDTQQVILWSANNQHPLHCHVKWKYNVVLSGRGESLSVKTTH